jgi:glutamine synthetase
VTLDELRKAVEKGDVDTVLLTIADMEGRLQGKRLTAGHFLDEVVEHDAEGCNYLLAVDVDMNTVDGYAMSSWERGYGDFVMKPDMDTLRTIPWHEGTVLVMADLAWEDGSDVVASPRQILRKQLARLAERGWVATAGTELEFIVFRDSYEDAWRKAYRDLEPANLYNVDYSMIGTARVEPLLRRIRNSMTAANMRVENSKGECNFGQHEINFHYDQALATADDHVIYKTGARRRSRPRRACRSPTWRRSTSARATPATSTARSSTRAAAASSPTTSRPSTTSWPASSRRCVS